MARPLVLIDGICKQLPNGEPVDMGASAAAFLNASAGQIRFGSRLIADFPFMAMIGPDGKERILEPSGLNSTALMACSGGSGTSITHHGGQLTMAGTVSAQAMGSTWYSSKNRSRIATSTTAGNAAGWRNNSIGEFKRQHGAILIYSFSIALLVTGQRSFLGVSNSISAQSNIDPLADTTISKIGIAHNTNTGNLSFINNNAGTAPTVSTLSNDFAVNTANEYTLYINFKPNGGDVVWQIFRLDSADGSYIFSQSGTIAGGNANLPATTTPLGRYGLVTNNAQASAAALDFQSLKLFPY